MSKQMPSTEEALTRREFIAATGATWAATCIPLAWSSTSVSAPSPVARSWVQPGIERYRTIVDGLWRTHAWHSGGGTCRLELPPLGNDHATGWGAASVPEGFIQIARSISVMPQRIRCEELSRGIGLAEIRRDFGDGVLQELQEEIRYRS